MTTLTRHIECAIGPDGREYRVTDAAVDVAEDGAEARLDGALIEVWDEEAICGVTDEPGVWKAAGLIPVEVREALEAELVEDFDGLWAEACEAEESWAAEAAADFYREDRD